MNAKERGFIAIVWKYYKENGRHELPWRKTDDPYLILVSELMLQQTQVGRVIPKYEAFIKKYPSAKKLSKASLGDVLRLWQGLGYNRRAKYLHECAKVVTERCGGVFPQSYVELQKLPGIGPYTAAAMMNFAHNIPTPLIETNVRTVYLHHFFKNEIDVSDTTIMQKIQKTIDPKNPKEWFAALMDYGSHLKQTIGNANTRSRHYTKQSKFKGSDREIRGAILRVLAEHGSMSETELSQSLASFETSRIDSQLEKLKSEDLVFEKGRLIGLP